MGINAEYMGAVCFSSSSIELVGRNT